MEVSGLEQLVIAFIEEVKSKEHLAPFLRNVTFSIGIQSEDEFIIFMIEEGGISLCPSSHLAESTIHLSGSINSIAAVLSGEKKLRMAINQGEIKSATTFRNLLFLESLFILAKKYHHYV